MRRMQVLSTAIFDKPAFKNLVCNGLVLAQDGKKMSKRLKNYPDPTVVRHPYATPSPPLRPPPPNNCLPESFSRSTRTVLTSITQ